MSLVIMHSFCDTEDECSGNDQTSLKTRVGFLCVSVYGCF